MERILALQSLEGEETLPDTVIMFSCSSCVAGSCGGGGGGGPLPML